MDLALAIWRINPAAAYRLTDDKAAILEWRGPGTQPTTAELQAAWDAYQTTQTQAASDAATLRQAIITQASGAVGVKLTDLTAAQVKALLACVLFKAGAVDKGGVVQPLNTWL